VIRFLNAYFPARTVFLGLSEACLVTLAFIAATIARFGTFDGTIVLNYQQGFIKIILVAAVFIACMYYFDLYDSMVVSNRREVLTRLVQVVGTACVILAGVYYAYPPLELGRGILALGIVLVALLLAGWRRAFWFVNSLPHFSERTLILGEGLLADDLIAELEVRRELGLRVVGHIKEENGASAGSTNGHWVQEVSRFVESQRPHSIIVTMTDRRGKLPGELLLKLKGQGVRIKDGPEVYEMLTGKLPVEGLRLSWLLFSDGFYMSPSMRIYKRLLSIAVSSVALLLCAPFLPLIALAIKLTSSGPVFYRQARVGRDGAIFHCYKFRTMRKDAEADVGPTWASDEDPRITPVGRFLRRLRLDEIPQLWNVLRGDMAFVGPRPERPEFVDWLKREIPFYELRHTICPGITGWAQVRYQYGSSVEQAKEKLRYDLFYIKNGSVGLDLLIVFETVKIILLGRGAR
jgi:sugar transferase (PEP-CTERM system associated)